MLAKTTFTASLASAAAARRFVAQALEIDGVDHEVVDLAELLTSEIVTNAVVHAAGPAEVGVDRVGDAVRVEVVDAASALPDLRHVAPDAASGRGLAIVDALATRWGVQPRGTSGKVVWFELGTGIAR
ncbi:MAG TPA: ATP-binding protein [Acidimicrobiales bacterium]|nr:ATP-binding protein [Acidimicrobiales bacterium]